MAQDGEELWKNWPLRQARCMVEAIAASFLDKLMSPKTPATGMTAPIQGVTETGRNEAGWMIEIPSIFWTVVQMVDAKEWNKCMPFDDPRGEAHQRRCSRYLAVPTSTTLPRATEQRMQCTRRLPSRARAASPLPQTAQSQRLLRLTRAAAESHRMMLRRGARTHLRAAWPWGQPRWTLPRRGPHS
jgi:hypothetical protein